MDARRLAVSDINNCSGGTPASAQRLRTGVVRRAPRASRRAADWIVSLNFKVVLFV